MLQWLKVGYMQAKILETYKSDGTTWVHVVDAEFYLSATIIWWLKGPNLFYSVHPEFQSFSQT